MDRAEWVHLEALAANVASSRASLSRLCCRASLKVVVEAYWVALLIHWFASSQHRRNPCSHMVLLLAFLALSFSLAFVPWILIVVWLRTFKRIRLWLLRHGHQVERYLVGLQHFFQLPVKRPDSQSIFSHIRAQLCQLPKDSFVCAEHLCKSCTPVPWRGLP